MSFMFRDRKETEFDYGSTFDDNFKKVKKMEKKYSLCIHYRDNDFCEKKIFQSKRLALDFFEIFRRINKRPVTITFYCGNVPYWVFRYERDKDCSATL